MDELLTAKEVQDLLKVDRTTIYRMLDDGRLTGIKVGQQWRFPRSSIQSLVEGKPSASLAAVPSPAEALPIHCLQPIQDVFAEIMGIGAVTTAPDGQPATGISNCCRFCSLMLASESGRAACIASWRNLARQPDQQPHFVECHAGLQYARARIELEGRLTAMLIAGQFSHTEPDAREEAERIKRLARTHSIAETDLSDAARSLPRLNAHKRSEIGRWLEQVAHTFEQIGNERANLMARLKQISEMTKFDTSDTE